MDHQNPPQVLVHLYRAAVGHADIWRQRLDATTNWAVITTAAVLTFAFSNTATPHFVVLLALLFVIFFLYMESRRYQAYNLWQRRIRVLDRALIVPALRPASEVDDEQVRVLRERLADDFGTWFPALPLWAALGYRLRRNFGPLITLILLAWLLKLYIHPDTAVGIGSYVARATVGLVPGIFVLAGMGVFFLSLVVLALSAPSEQMRGWSLLPAPLERIRPGGKAEERPASGNSQPDRRIAERRRGDRRVQDRRVEDRGFAGRRAADATGRPAAGDGDAAAADRDAATGDGDSAAGDGDSSAEAGGA